MVFENLMALHIAVEKECTVEVAFKWLDRYLNNSKEYKMRPYFTWTPEDVEDVIKFKQQGLTHKEIGSYYGTTDKYITYLLNREVRRINDAK